TANRCKRRLGWAILVPASPSTSGFWAIAPRSLVSVAAISTTCSPRKGPPDEDLRLVDVWIGDRPVDDGPVVPPGSAPMHRVKVAQREQAHGERTARDGLLYSVLVERGGVKTAAGPLALVPPGVDDPDRTAHDPLLERRRVVDVRQRLVGHRHLEEFTQRSPALARLPYQQPVRGHVGLDTVVPAIHRRGQAGV